MQTAAAPRILLLSKAIIRGGALSDLFATTVQVGGYTNAKGTYVPPHQAVRHKRTPQPAKPAAHPAPAATATDLFGQAAPAEPAKKPPRTRDVALREIGQKFAAAARDAGHDEEAQAAAELLAKEGGFTAEELQGLIRQVAQKERDKAAAPAVAAPEPAPPAAPAVEAPAPVAPPAAPATAAADPELTPFFVPDREMQKEGGREEAPAAAAAARGPDPAWAAQAMAEEADSWAPKIMAEPKAMFRSVSPAELADIKAKGAIIGGGNTFSDTRRHVFFADDMSPSVIRQGEELERQAHHALEGTPVGLAVDQANQSYEHAIAAAKLATGRKAESAALDAKQDAYETLSAAKKAYRSAIHDWMRARKEELQGADFTSAVLETQPLAGGLHYSKGHGLSGMPQDEYGFPSGHVQASDLARVHLVKDGKVVRTMSPAEAGLVPQDPAAGGREEAPSENNGGESPKPKHDPRGQLARTRARADELGLNLAQRMRAILDTAEAEARRREPGRGKDFRRGATTWTKRQEGWYQEEVRAGVEKEAPNLHALLATFDRVVDQAERQAKKLGLNEPWVPQTRSGLASVSQVRELLNDRDAKAEPPKAEEASSLPPSDEPKEGDVRFVDEVGYVLRGGRWHRLDPSRTNGRHPAMTYDTPGGAPVPHPLVVAPQAEWEKAIWDKMQQAWDEDQDIQLVTSGRHLFIPARRRDVMRFQGGQIQMKQGREWVRVGPYGQDINSLADAMGLPNSHDRLSWEAENRDTGAEQARMAQAAARLAPLLAAEEKARRAAVADPASAEREADHREALDELMRQGTDAGLTRQEVYELRSQYELPEEVEEAREGGSPEWQEDNLADVLDRLGDRDPEEGRPAGAFTAAELAAHWRGHTLEEAEDELHARVSDFALLPDGQHWMRMDEYLAGDAMERLREAQQAMADRPDMPAALQERLRAQAKRLAEAAVNQPPPSNDDMDPSSPNYRYRDQGYVGGSRKELAAEMIRAAGRNRTQLRKTDIDWEELEKNARLAKELIKKNNLFGQVDWDSLREGGMEPAAGYLLDRVYASIATEPAEDRPQARQDFALGLETVRDRLERCKTVEDVTNALGELREELAGNVLNAEEADAYAKAFAAYEIAKRAADAGQAQRDALRDTQYAAMKRWREIGEEVERQSKGKRKPDPALVREEARMKQEMEDAQKARDDFDAANPELVHKSHKLPGGWTAYDSDVGMVARTLRERAQEIKRAAARRNMTENPVTRAWLAMGPKFSAVLNYRSPKGSDAFQKHVTAARSGKVRDWSWAEKGGAADRPKVTKREQAFQLQVAEHHARRGGRQVRVDSTAELQSRFGLRAVQSGNWVLDDPTSAAFHVQRSAEAFADLADLMGVPDEVLSMNGRLALAFGARGRGGGARAHYEPVERVINMTKMGGGGCLAHEWLHAMDNLVKESEGVGPAGEKDWLTETPEILPPGPLRSAFEGIKAAMEQGTHRPMQKFKYSAKDHRVARYNVHPNASPSSSGTLGARVGKAEDATAAVLLVDDFYRSRYGEPENMSKRIRKQWEDWRRIAVAHHHGQVEGGEVSLPVGRPTSSFAVEAQRLDKGTTGKYWSQGKELAARAFQAWCEDRLAAQGRQNDYLSSLADNKYYRLTGAKPFPEAEERHRLNAAFDNLARVLAEQGTLAKALAMLEMEEAEERGLESVMMAV